MGDRDEPVFLTFAIAAARVAGTAVSHLFPWRRECSTRRRCAHSSRSACRLEDRSFLEAGAFNVAGC